MTVCVAVLCSIGSIKMIITASDRMLTYGDVEYEPDSTKIWILDRDRRLAALVSGEMAQQSLIATRVTARIREMDEPTVEDASRIYAEEFATFRREKNEATYLAPLGLTSQSLVEPGRVDPQLAEVLMQRMLATDLNDEVIVAGVNPDNTKHIYIVGDPGRAILMDTPGWAAIGSGRAHIDSEFTVERYQSAWSVERALLLMFTAKRRAEAAPGVGRTTDVSVINDSGFDFVRDTIVAGVEQANSELVEAERATRASMMDRMLEIVERAIAEPKPETQQVGPPSEEPPASGEADEAPDEGRI